MRRQRGSASASLPQIGGSAATEIASTTSSKSWPRFSVTGGGACAQLDHGDSRSTFCCLSRLPLSIWSYSGSAGQQSRSLTRMNGWYVPLVSLTWRPMVMAVDGLAVSGRRESIDPAEELEAHAALQQQLVERPGDDIAGGGLHLPQDRAAILPELEQAEEHRAGGDVALGAHVAARIGEDQVVQRAQHRRLLGEMKDAVAAQPVAVLHAIDALPRMVGIEQEAVLEPAQRIGSDEVEQGQQAAQPVIEPDPALHMLLQVLGRLPDQARHRGVVAPLMGDHDLAHPLGQGEGAAQLALDPLEQRQVALQAVDDAGMGPQQPFDDAEGRSTRSTADWDRPVCPAAAGS